MPSKGSPILQFRVDPLYDALIEADIESHNKHSPNEPLTRSAWGMKVVEHYFRWKQRCKKAQAKRKKVQS